MIRRICSTSRGILRFLWWRQPFSPLSCGGLSSFLIEKEENKGRRQLVEAFLPVSGCGAPMAAIYAIPVETFLTDYRATACNIWFLAIVATWRVLLIARVLRSLLRPAIG